MSLTENKSPGTIFGTFFCRFHISQALSEKNLPLTNSPTKTNIDGNENFQKDGASIIEFKKGTMEEIILRFPHLGESIFEQLDNESLAKSREVCDFWKNFVEGQTFYNLRLMRLIKSLTNCSDESLMKILQESNSDFITEFGSNVVNDCGKFLKKSREIDPDSSKLRYVIKG